MKSRALSIRKQSLQSIPLPLENKAIKTQRLQPELLDTNGAPLTMTKTTQIQLPQYDVPPPWAIYARKWTTPSSWSHIDCVARLQICSPSNNCVPLSTQCSWRRGMIHRVNTRLGSEWKTIFRFCPWGQGHFSMGNECYESIILQHIEDVARILWSSWSYF